MCGENSETVNHILFECQRSRRIWERRVPTFQRLPVLKVDFADAWACLWEVLGEGKMGVIAVICWSIWSDRNRKVQNQEIWSVDAKCEWIFNFVESNQKRCRLGGMINNL